LGKRRFGTPSNAIQAALEEISSIERLDRISDRLLEASTWEELLGSGAKRR
jgi:hypothetical protein